MTNFTEKLTAAMAALIIASVSITGIISVPPATDAAIVAPEIV